MASVRPLFRRKRDCLEDEKLDLSGKLGKFMDADEDTPAAADDQAAAEFLRGELGLDDLRGVAFLGFAGVVGFKAKAFSVCAS
jgi:hypothetical protein